VIRHKSLTTYKDIFISDFDMRTALAIFRALADPTRLRILALLRAMELSVGELAQVLGQSQPRVSRHVKILADAGLAERRKEGSWVFLGLGPAAQGSGSQNGALLAAIEGWSERDGDHWAVADAARLVAVRADRVAAAEQYFDAHAAEWDAIRSLHVAEAQVEAAIAEQLADGPIGRLVDIGTGTGRMIELFGPAADSAVGIDRSPEMLRLARAKLAALPQVELRQGDIYALPLADGVADTVVIHQVLHYAQQPGAAIAEAARLLPGGGRLLIVDFASHEREELRTQDAHVRLGFADDQIATWFAAAGLAGEPPIELRGGELTVKLWLGRRIAAAGAGTHLKVVAA
jgi:ubiquinone/menaquinone biosynthesis C-methylase UbiE/DNA-binding transcriptional ArsR family regulator